MHSKERKGTEILTKKNSDDPSNSPIVPTYIVAIGSICHENETAL